MKLITRILGPRGFEFSGFFDFFTARQFDACDWVNSVHSFFLKLVIMFCIFGHVCQAN